MRPLTQREVDQLPAGAVVQIAWHGIVPGDRHTAARVDLHGLVFHKEGDPWKTNWKVVFAGATTIVTLVSLPRDDTLHYLWVEWGSPDGPGWLLTDGRQAFRVSGDNARERLFEAIQDRILPNAPRVIYDGTFTPEEALAFRGLFDGR